MLRPDSGASTSPRVDVARPRERWIVLLLFARGNSRVVVMVVAEEFLPDRGGRRHERPTSTRLANGKPHSKEIDEVTKAQREQGSCAVVISCARRKRYRERENAYQYQDDTPALPRVRTRCAT